MRLRLTSARARYLPLTETTIRLSVFLTVFGIMALAETVLPRRTRSLLRRRRWPGNLSLVLLDSVAARFLIPGTALATAALAADRGWGLLSFVHLPVRIEFVIAVVVLDLAIYAQHVASHALPFLWKVHRVHHTDLDLDVTSGLRFHPVEIVLSMWWKLCVILLLGPSPTAVLVFEIVLNASALFNHSNLALPERIDSWLRRLVVTPDMHRIHHSVIAQETHSNFGFNLSCWDRLFRTYRNTPAAGQTGMTIGLPEWKSERDVQPLLAMLLMPAKDARPLVAPEANTPEAHQTPEYPDGRTFQRGP